MHQIHEIPWYLSTLNRVGAEERKIEMCLVTVNEGASCLFGGSAL